MIILDADLLIAAFHFEVEHHASSRAWIESAIASGIPVAAPSQCLREFTVAVTGNQRFDTPASADAAERFILHLRSGNFHAIGANRVTWDRLVSWVDHGFAERRDTTAFIAALALSHGASVATLSDAYDRFGVTLVGPLRDRPVDLTDRVDLTRSVAPTDQIAEANLAAVTSIPDTPIVRAFLGVGEPTLSEHTEGSPPPVGAPQSVIGLLADAFDPARIAQSAVGTRSRGSKRDNARRSTSGPKTETPAERAERVRSAFFVPGDRNARPEPAEPTTPEILPDPVVVIDSRELGAVANTLAPADSPMPEPATPSPGMMSDELALSLIQLLLSKER